MKADSLVVIFGEHGAVHPKRHLEYSNKYFPKKQLKSPLIIR